LVLVVPTAMETLVRWAGEPRLSVPPAGIVTVPLA
jgi:hypothetical protein